MDIGMRAMSSDMGGILTYPGRGMKVLTTRRSLGLRRRPLLGTQRLSYSMSKVHPGMRTTLSDAGPRWGL